MEGDGAHLAWFPVTLTAKLQAVGSQWVKTGWPRPHNDCIDDIIELYDE